MSKQTVLLHDTWRELILEFTPELVGLFDYYYSEGGVVTVCKQFDEAAFALIVRDIHAPKIVDIATALAKYPLSTQLQVLRFGKRFTPSEYTEEESKTIISGFLAMNNSRKLYDRHGLPWWLEQELREISKEFFSGITYKPRSLSPREWYLSLPSGVTAEGLKTPFEKILYLYSMMEGTDPYKWQVPDAPLYRTTTSKLVLVPKDYRGPRLICEEPIIRQLDQTPLAEFIQKALKRKRGRFHSGGRVDLNDQDRNRSQCLVASQTRWLATIDLKRASDSLTYSVLSAIIPSNMVNDLINCLASEVALPNGSVKPLYIACTMGARVTFPIETLCFWLIVCAAARTCINFGVGNYTWLDDCAVYGDDIIVPCEWYDTVVDYLTFAGFTVNERKSFTGDTGYRESCGSEYLDGEEISSIYWPRRDMSVNREDIPSLIALANRLWSIGAMRARDVVVKLLDTMIPGIPRVSPESTDEGITDYAVSRRYAPAYGYIVVDILSCGTTYKDPRVLTRLLTACRQQEDWYTLVDTVVVETFDNRRYSAINCFSGKVRQLTTEYFELFEYERWLALGSEYFDPLCELLHVTKPSRVGDRMIPSSYAVSKTAYTVYDPYSAS